MAFGVAIGLAWTVTKVSVPLLVRGAIDRGIEADDAPVLYGFTAAIVMVGLAQALFSGLRRYSAFRLGRRIEAGLRDRLFAHIQRLHFAYHDRAQTGQLMSRGNTDLQQLQAFVIMVPLAISNAFTAIAVAVVLVVMDPVLALVALGIFPLVNVLATRFGRRLQPAVMGIQQESAELASVVEESVSGVRVVKGFGAEDVRRRRFGAEARDLRERSVEAVEVRASFLPAIELLPTIALVAVLGYGGHQVLEGQLSLGSLVAFNVYVVMLVWPLRLVGLLLFLAQRAVAAATRVDEVLATAPQIVDRATAQPLRPGPGELRFEGVTFAYPGTSGDGHGDPSQPAADRPGGTVLVDLDLVIPAGESVALVGATGSGKSTLARLVPRFYDVVGGRVSLDGVDVRDLRLRDLRRAVGIVFEDTFLFNDTVGANIAFADPDAAPRDVAWAARLAGAAEFVERLPRGYETQIGERGYTLSGGQRQRIAIARAILADPRVLILDDATSSVDPTKEHEIRQALAEVMRGRTTIVIAHRAATIALADRVVLLDDGRVVAEGTHAHLLANSERYGQVLASARSQGRVMADGRGTTP